MQEWRDVVLAHQVVDVGGCLAVLVRTASGLEFTEFFSLGELGGDNVRYHFMTMTRDQFNKEAPCAVK